MAYLLAFGAFLVGVEEHPGAAPTCVQEPLVKRVNTGRERRGRRVYPVVISDDAFKEGLCPGLPLSGASRVARAHGKRGQVAILIGVAIHVANFGDLQAQAHIENAVTRAVIGSTTRQA